MITTDEILKKNKAKVLIMCGELCNSIELGDKKLLDYFSI